MTSRYDEATAAAKERDEALDRAEIERSRKAGDRPAGKYVVEARKRLPPGLAWTAAEWVLHGHPLSSFRYREDAEAALAGLLKEHPQVMAGSSHEARLRIVRRQPGDEKPDPNVDDPAPPPPPKRGPIDLGLADAPTIAELMQG